MVKKLCPNIPGNVTGACREMSAWKPSHRPAIAQASNRRSQDSPEDICSQSSCRLWTGHTAPGEAVRLSGVQSRHPVQNFLGDGSECGVRGALGELLDEVTALLQAPGELRI